MCLCVFVWRILKHVRHENFSNIPIHSNYIYIFLFTFCYIKYSVPYTSSSYRMIIIMLSMICEIIANLHFASEIAGKGKCKFTCVVFSYSNVIPQIKRI